MSSDLAAAQHASLRDQIAAVETYAYFDHAAKGPLTRGAADALRAYADDVEHHGGRNWPRWWAQIAEVRAKLATLIGADAGEMALMPNTAAAIGTVAEGVDWRDGDNVVVPAAEFPSNLFPWRNLESRGVTCRVADVGDARGTVDLAKLDAACDDRTRLIACSWVGWSTGYRVDLASLCEIAERHGSRLLVDGIQAVGVRHLNVRETPIDYLAGECRKWLLSPEGLGYLFVRRDRQEELRPTRAGWASMSQEDPFGDRFAFHDDARRFETGMPAFALVAAANASLDALAAETPAGREAVIGGLSERMVEVLTAAGGVVASERGDRGSAIVAAEFAGRDLEAMRTAMAEAGVVVSVRSGRIRVSPHAYNTAEDVQKLADALKEAAG